MSETPQLLSSALMGALPAGVILIDDDNRVLAVNEQLRSLVPLHPSPEGRLLQDAVPVSSVVDALHLSGDESQTSEASVSVGRFELLVRTVNMGDGQGVLGVVTDVTESRSVERARSNFAVSVSHELRTPLTSILGYTDTLLSDETSLGPETVEMLQAIRRNGERMGRLFSDLLHLFRLESRQGDLPLEPLSLSRIAAEVLEQWGTIASEMGIELLLDSPVDVSGLINPEACRHIMGNLVSNALKYTEPEGWVHVRVREEENSILVEVEDNGPGIEPIYHQRIFERFFRADSGRSRTHGGTGLGLSIVKHLCQASQARITVHSMPGHGSTFSVRFPSI